MASAADIDLAMRAGVNYPQGPLAWADAIGLEQILTVLDNLQATYGEERYRPSLLLRRRVAEGRTFHD
ncbi:3-hydroxyadipyl-CoA dehydrogenase [compost metagenome]